MDNQPEVIRQQMEETRTSLQDKLEVLEQQVLNTVQDANQTVETVKETVEAVRDTVQDTVASVKDSVHDTVENVKDSVKATFDFERHVQQHPWAMLAGAAVVGYVAERVLTRLTAPVQQVPQANNLAAPTFATTEIVRHHRRGNGKATTSHQAKQSAPGGGFWGFLTSHYRDELEKVKSLAVSALGGAAREIITEAVAPAMAERIKDVIDGVTVKMGGQPFEDPILDFGGRPKMSESA